MADLGSATGVELVHRRDASAQVGLDDTRSGKADLRRKSVLRKEVYIGAGDLGQLVNPREVMRNMHHCSRKVPDLRTDGETLSGIDSYAFYR